MCKLGISAINKKRAYHSYRGLVGKVAPNIIARDFHTDRPFQKLETDITQFTIASGKLYFSPIIDFHT